MIINRLFGGKGFNVGYIIGEVLLIFVGITLSFYFEEWRTNRQNRRKEIELLREIYSAVKTDTVRMQNLANLYDKTSKKMIFLLDSTRNEKVLSNKSKECFGYLNYYVTFAPDWSAYNDLKSQGLDLISNTELRTRLIRYYEFVDSQSKWTDNIYNMHFKTSVLPYVIDEFSVYLVMNKGIPEDFEGLKKNKRFWKIVQRTKMFNDITSENFKRGKDSAIRFLKELDQDLNK